MRTSAAVENITSDGVVIAGKLLPAKTVIWTAGVAASAAGQWLGAAVDRAGRVKVEANLSVPDHPNVFVVGDTACVIQDGKLLPGVAPVAMQEGRYVASLIAQKVAGKDNKDNKDNVPPFHYHDKGNLPPWDARLALWILAGSVSPALLRLGDMVVYPHLLPDRVP